MTQRRGRARLGVLALLLPVSAGLAVASAPSALAAATWTSPSSDGATLTSAAPLAVSVAACSSVTCPTTTLSVTGPGGYSRSASVTASRNGATALSVPVGARNGQYTGTLSDGSSGVRTLYLAVAPATPSGFSGQASDYQNVMFSWTRGSEADLAGYVLYDGSGAVVDDAISLSACKGSACDYAVYYPNGNPGTHGYKLAARRAGGGCSSCAAQVTSGTTSTSVRFEDPPPPPPPPAPEPGPTSTGGTGGSTGGSTSGTSGSSGSTSGTSGSTSGTSTGGTGGSGTSGTSGSSTGSTGGTGGSSTGTSGGAPVGGSSSTGSSTGAGAKPVPRPSLPSLSDQVLAARKSFALQFKAFAPSLGIPKLAPLPALTLPQVSGEAPLPDGSYERTLPYAAPTVTEPIGDSGGLARPVSAVRDALDSARLLRSLAGAMILLMLGAHVRRFLGTTSSD